MCQLRQSRCHDSDSRAFDVGLWTERPRQRGHEAAWYHSQTVIERVSGSGALACRGLTVTSEGEGEGEGKAARARARPATT